MQVAYVIQDGFQWDTVELQLLLIRKLYRYNKIKSHIYLKIAIKIRRPQLSYLKL